MRSAQNRFRKVVYVVVEAVVTVNRCFVRFKELWEKLFCSFSIAPAVSTAGFQLCGCALLQHLLSMFFQQVHAEIASGFDPVLMRLRGERSNQA